jgi:hypothetical protein
MNTKLDHIVIAATSLKEGVDFVRESFGVDIPIGGRHQMMGTHNCVMSLGDDIYLEVIAIDPDAAAPSYPRWFGLDDPFVRKHLQRGPALLTWAVNTENLDKLVDNSLVPLGAIQNAQRDDLRWRVAISEDGRMPGAGLLPLCIQWQMDFHPSQGMKELGCRLLSLDIYHSSVSWISDSLQSIGANRLVNLKEITDDELSHMVCRFQCPLGEIELTSLHLD